VEEMLESFAGRGVPKNQQGSDFAQGYPRFRVSKQEGMRRIANKHLALHQRRKVIEKAVDNESSIV
jgi:hypothetical protein